VVTIECHLSNALDVGGGESRLVDALLDRGVTGSAIIATFAPVNSRPYLHTTPWGATQAFQYAWFRKR
jgi:hypothetical protein